VTVGDAFHWFDKPAALTEIRRVLCPHGGLAVLSAVPDWSGASWAHELGSLVAALRPEHPQFDELSWQEVVRASGHWSEPREIRFTIARSASAEQVVDHVASISWMAALPQEQRASTIARARELVQAGETPAELPVHIVLGLTSLL